MHIEKRGNTQCENDILTIDNQLVESSNKLSWGHIVIFLKGVVHIPSVTKTRHFR